MKVFNFGSDYAYQQKQKEAAKEANASIAEEPIVNLIDNVANQIQAGGEGEIDPAPETEKTPKPKSKKKKENREETKEDYQTDSQVQ